MKKTIASFSIEYLQILDENGNKTGQVKLRLDVRKDGDWHRAGWYVLLSVTMSLAGAFAGLALAKELLELKRHNGNKVFIGFGNALETPDARRFAASDLSHIARHPD